MRIVSLLPSATEILFALGFDREIVGVSHECNFPPQARTKRMVVHSRLPAGTSPSEIDQRVRQYVAHGESLYAVDVRALEELRPDLIVTQDLCHVCAASPDDLASALAHFSAPPQVLCLNPQDLGDVWRDILWVGETTRRGRPAEVLVESIGSRLCEIDQKVAETSERPRIAFLEWLEPFYVGGHWVPDMIARAGGVDLFGAARRPSFRITLEDIVNAAPDVLLIAPCGYSAEQASAEYGSMVLPDQWHAIPAVREDRVYALEANSYFSRPGPRLVTGIEVLAKVCHPAIQVSPEAESAILQIPRDNKSARAASN